MENTSTDWRALCAELHAAFNTYAVGEEHHQLLVRAATALAQPEPEGPTDEALASFTAYFCRNYPGPDTIIYKPEWHAPKIFRAAAGALTRWGRPAIKPVPVSERLPGPEDCDEEGRCWFFRVAMDGVGDWYQRKPFVTGRAYSPFRFTHWLPHHALPAPTTRREEI